MNGNDSNVRKAIRVLAYAYFLSLSNRAYSSLTTQSEAVILEVSTVEVLRADPQRMHEAKYLP